MNKPHDIYPILSEFTFTDYPTFDPQIAEKIVHTLQKANLTLSTAESLTGGAVGAAITAIPGASGVYRGGFITYTDQAKEQLLHIPHEILIQHSAVSMECAQAMAENTRQILHSDFALALTGFAGPGSGNKFHPVGTVFIALNTAQDTFIHKLYFSNPLREPIRQACVEYALQLLLSQL